MHRFHLPPEECRQSTLHLAGREAHHALHVLRLRSGDKAVVLDGAGSEFLCQAAGSSRNTLEMKVLEKKSFPPPCQVTLLQAVPKGKLIENIIEKATELSAARIVPLQTERTIPRFEQDAADKTEKWQLVAIEATKQCGAAWLPKVEMPMSPKDFLSRGEQFELPLVASLQPGARHPRECFRTFQTQHRRHPRSVSIWIGPEGDFTLAEIEMLQNAGALPITLGPLVLRTETAAIYCLSIINYETSTPT